MTITDLKQLKESEDKVEFKEGKGQYSYKSNRRGMLELRDELLYSSVIQVPREHHE